jgi:hypothetical protein
MSGRSGTAQYSNAFHAPIIRTHPRPGSNLTGHAESGLRATGDAFPLVPDVDDNLIGTQKERSGFRNACMALIGRQYCPGSASPATWIPARDRASRPLVGAGDDSARGRCPSPPARIGAPSEFARMNARRPRSVTSSRCSWSWCQRSSRRSRTLGVAECRHRRGSQRVAESGSAGTELRWRPDQFSSARE